MELVQSLKKTLINKVIAYYFFVLKQIFQFFKE